MLVIGTAKSSPKVFALAVTSYRLERHLHPGIATELTTVPASFVIRPTIITRKMPALLGGLLSNRDV